MKKKECVATNANTTKPIVFKLERPNSNNMKTLFSCKLDENLQTWIRRISHENGVFVADTVHQIVSFAKNHYVEREK